METTTPTTPLTRWQARIRNDFLATAHYRRRPDIERWHEDRELEQQLKEAWDD